MMRTGHLILAGSGVVIGMIGYYFLLIREPVRFGSQANPDTVDVWRLIIGFLLTILGVVIGVIYRLLQEEKNRGERYIKSFKLFASNIGRSIDLWIGFCGAPLVFALLMQSTDGASWPGLIAVALQNGFCCAIIADRFMAQKSTPAEG